MQKLKRYTNWRSWKRAVKRDYPTSVFDGDKMECKANVVAYGDFIFGPGDTMGETYEIVQVAYWSWNTDWGLDGTGWIMEWKKKFLTQAPSFYMEH